MPAAAPAKFMGLSSRAARCVITSLPLALLYNFFLDRFIAGFTVGAVK